jgi:hypoxanthine phosphoribosyltransferase
MTIRDDIERVLVSEDDLHDRIVSLGKRIAADYEGRPLLLVGVLKGAVPFLADLARAIDAPLEMDFMAVSSYGNAMQSQGYVRILKDLDDPITGRDVLLVEDIIDSGLTLSAVLELLRQRHPSSLQVCTLLNKVKARTKHVNPIYTGFNVADEFVVGYGLDYRQRYRNLPFIGVLKPEIYA